MNQPVVGIIAEYNPFHNGHLYQIKAIRKKLGNDLPIVVVLSGSFTQRGEAAIAEKFTRAKWAVLGGINLVVELPTVFAVASAQHFASGGVRLLKEIGASVLAFGAETDDLEKLRAAAAAVDDIDAGTELQNYLKTGSSYAAALAKITAAKSFSAASPETFETELKLPNNILAIQYLRAVNKFAPAMQPLLIARKNAAHNDSAITGSIASGSAIRAALSNGEHHWHDAVPAFAAADLKILFADGAISNTKNLFAPLLGRLLPLTAADIRELAGISEGIENLVYAAAHNPSITGYDNFLAALKSKRYTYTRLQRFIITALLNLKKDAAASFAASGSLYIRPLAFDEVGRDILHKIKAISHLPIINRVAAVFPYLERRSASGESFSPLQKMLSFDLNAADLWRLTLSGSAAKNVKSDTQQKIFYCRENRV